MTSYSHHATQNKHENRQTMGTKDTRYCEERFIKRSFLVLEILSGGTKSKKPMVNRINVEIVNYTLFISTSKFESQIQFCRTHKLSQNDTSKRYLSL